MAEKTETQPLHTLTLNIDDGCVYPDLVCPHEGKTFAANAAPICRLFDGPDFGGDVSESCLAVEAWGANGVDCLEVDDHRPFKVTQYPIPVTYRWEGWGEDAEFWVAPATVPASEESL
jgi:hypothetical protein